MDAWLLQLTVRDKQILKSPTFHPLEIPPLAQWTLMLSITTAWTVVDINFHNTIHMHPQKVERLLTTHIQQESQLSLTNRPTLPSGEWLLFIGLIFRFLPTPFPFDALNEADPLDLSASYMYEETRMAGLQSGEGRPVIDSVVWAQYIIVTNTQTATSQ